MTLHLPNLPTYLLLPDHCDLPTSTNPDSIGEHGMLTEAFLFTLHEPVAPLTLPLNIALMFLDTQSSNSQVHIQHRISLTSL